jgi:hypothetical protein
MEELAKIFGSAARVKIMRLFLANAGTAFSVDTISSRSRVPKATVQKELRLLTSVNFVRKTKVSETVLKKVKATKKKPAHVKESTKTVVGYEFSPEFSMKKAFRDLLIESELMNTKALADRFKKFRPKLLVVAGSLTPDSDGDVDLLIVSDRLNKKEVEKVIGIIESEIGRELRYALFETEEFMYRIKMFDKLLRDIFDYPHQKVIDKLKLSSY